MKLTRSFIFIIMAIVVNTQIFADPLAQENKALVLKFLTQIYSEGSSKDLGAFFSSDYVEHDISLEPGENGWKGVVDMSASTPERFWKAYRCAASGDLVAIHSQFKQGLKSTILLDVFRIGPQVFTEHWKISQPEVLRTANGNTMVDGDEGRTEAEGVAEKNKKTVAEMIDLLFAKGQAQAGDRLVREDYIQHNPHVAHGRVALKKLFAGRINAVSVRFSVAEGNLVFCMMNYPNTIIVDIFRVQDGLVAEHWDVRQGEPSPQTVPPGRSLW